MKKIINGKKYDTETAKKLGEVNHGSYNDFAHYSEELYIKRTGEYFMYGEGGPMTKYRRQDGDNCWSGGDKIIPMSEAEAREWAERNMDADEYEAAFGPVEE